MASEDAQALVATVERLLDDLERMPDRSARERTTEVVQALLELYGAGLERIVEELAARDDGDELALVLSEDELVSHLLLLHGLHPTPPAERVLGALEEVRPYLESHGGNVELLDVSDGVVRLALEGSCSGCPSSAMTLKLAIEQAIHKAAPEIEQVVADGATTPEPAAPGAGLLQLELAGPLQHSAQERTAPDDQHAPAAKGAPENGSWTMAGGIPELSGGGALVKPIGGQPILFLKLDGRLYGYRPRCPACEHSLAGAALEGIELCCPQCGVRYDALRAGRCLDMPSLHLDPVPLLVGEDGLAKVALASAL